MFYFEIQTSIKNIDKTFIYSSLEQLEIGQLVKVVLGKRKLSGWVISKISTNEIEKLGLDLEKISSIYSVSKKSISSDLVDLSKWLSHYTMTGLSSILRFCEPTQKKVSYKYNQIPLLPISFCEKKYRISPYQSRLELIKKISNTEIDKNHIFIIPEAEIVSKWKEIKNVLPKNAIVGSRKTIFNTVDNIASINIFDSTDELYYEQRRPYWNVLDIARLRSSQLDCELRFFSIFFQSNEDISNEYFFENSKNIRTLIVEKDNNDISSKSIAKVKGIVDKKLKTIILLNRPLEDNRFICNKCEKHSFQNIKCEVCGGKSFYAIGLGANSLEKVLKNLFPNSNVSKSLGSEIVLTKLSELKLMLNDQKVNIGCVVFLDLDWFCMSTIQNIQSQGMKELVSIFRILASQKNDVEVILETNDANNNFYQAVNRKKWEYWDLILYEEMVLLQKYPFKINVLIEIVDDKNFVPSLELSNYIQGYFENKVLIQFENDVEYFSKVELIKEAVKKPDSVIIKVNPAKI